MCNSHHNHHTKILLNQLHTNKKDDNFYKVVQKNYSGKICHANSAMLPNKTELKVKKEIAISAFYQ